MKATLALGLFTAITTLAAGPALAKPNAPKGAPPPPAEPAPAPPPPAAPGQEANHHQGKTSFWMAADPHVPLAVVQGHKIHSIAAQRGKECGSEERWAKPKSHWKAVDAYGQLTGTFEVKGAELYDVTGCHEVQFAPRSGKQGVGLFVSEDSGYKPGKSVQYSPTLAEQKRFDKFMNVVETAYVDHRPYGKAAPLAKRSMFFEFEPPKDPNWVERLDGENKRIQRPKRWAVSGGSMMTVSFLNGNGHWKVSTVKPVLNLANSYKPVAVFDLDGDGIPEIIYQSSDGPTFAEHVLRLNRETMSWEEAAESPGGATI